VRAQPSSYAGRRWKKHAVCWSATFASIARSGTADCVEDEMPDAATAMLDYLTLGFRLREGVSQRAFAERFGVDLQSLLGGELDWFLAGGALELEGDRIRISADHQLLTNEILVRLEGSRFRSGAKSASRRFAAR